MSKKRFKPVFLLLFGLFLSLQSAAQVTLKSTVRDQNTGAPLPFCTVAVVGKNQGCLSNEEGRFEITVATRTDSLRFQYLGYQPLTRCARDLLQAPDVRLEPAEYQLGEVEIFAGADYLYDLVGRCRKRLQAARPTPARVYFSLDTEISQRPVEMLECYYNGVVNGSQITTLDLKAGRIGLAPQAGGRIFVSLNSSEALRLVNLTTGSERLPPIPLQYRGRQLPKNFVLSRKNSRDTTLQRIDFEPVRGKNGFSGEMWIEKSSANLRRITLSIDSAAVYPFAPYRPHDSLLQVGLEITQEFAATPAGPRLQYIDFKYSIRLLNWLDSGGFDPQPRRIFTTGRMVCYDYGQPFLLPLFEPEQNRYPTSTDYGKIADRPYNPGFWAHNTSLAYTERQERILHFLQTEGKLLNFQQRLGWHDNEPFLEHNNVCWSDTQRV